MPRWLGWLITVVGACLGPAAPAVAGGGPETTLVVVNADAPSSLRVANAYVRLRDVPASHVLYLEGVPAQGVVSLNVFRDQILKPIESYLEAHGLAEDVDTIAYSTDFPFGVNFDAEVKEKEFPIRQPVSRTASLTGLTYLYRHVLAGDPAAYLGMEVNGYYRRDARAPRSLARHPKPQELARIRDYRGAIQSKDYGRAAENLAFLVQAFPEHAPFHYDLACCLAVLGRKDEALAALERAVEHGFGDDVHAAGDLDLESLRGDETFERLLEKMRDAPPVQPSRAFSARRAWTAEDAAPEGADSPHRYRLAIMLGWTGTQGNTVDEVLGCLETAAASDGTHPDGTVYLMANDNVRATTRMPYFERTQAALRRLGRKAEILVKGEDGQDGQLPRGKRDALGIVAGSAGLKWNANTFDLLPGSIAEHLTSFGAKFDGSGQTKCTEFIRHGAAGTSGTVAEPYATPHKFPSPWLHYHYAGGCSLAEAYYQSVWGPYQLLILGDPLARPFVRFGEVTLAAPSADAPWTGVVAVEARVAPAPGHAPTRVELWVDGRAVGTADPGELIAWDTTTVADGVHDVRLVMVDAGAIATRSYGRYDVTVANAGAILEVSGPDAPVELADPVRLEGPAGDLAEVELRQGGRVLVTETVKGRTWTLEVPAVRLGQGGTVLFVLGRTEAGVAVQSRPVAVEVVPPTTLVPPLIVEEPEMRPGLHAAWTNADAQETEAAVGNLGAGPGRTLLHDLAAAGGEDATRLVLDGMVHLPTSGAWFLELRTQTAVRFVFAGRERVALAEPPAGGRVQVALGLARGWHALRLETEGEGAGKVALYLSGPRSAFAPAGADLAHRPDGLMAGAPPDEARLGVDGGGAPEVLDGKRDDRGVEVGPEGLVLAWKRSQRNLQAVTLYPFRGGRPIDFPEAWIVEIRTSTRGRWKPVRKLWHVICPGPEAPRRDRTPPPLCVILRFDKVSARQVRLRPVEPVDGARVAEVAVSVKEKDRR